jgi:hypothetical protein
VLLHKHDSRHAHGRGLCAAHCSAQRMLSVTCASEAATSTPAGLQWLPSRAVRQPYTSWLTASRSASLLSCATAGTPALLNHARLERWQPGARRVLSRLIRTPGATLICRVSTCMFARLHDQAQHCHHIFASEVLCQARSVHRGGTNSLCARPICCGGLIWHQTQQHLCSHSLKALT